MLTALFLPLLISWIFKTTGWKWVFLTYVISGLTVIFLPIVLLIIQTINLLMVVGAPDTAAIATGLTELLGGIAIHLFIALYFQHIYNRTFELSGKI